MVTVKLEKECGCFKDARNIDSEMSFDTKDAAMLYAKGLCRTINDQFCGKHFFRPEESADDEVMIKLINR
ncbi:hypothetical protein ACXWTF_03335 [Thiomicrolovo sp. ZZH C-3]